MNWLIKAARTDVCVSLPLILQKFGGQNIKCVPNVNISLFSCGAHIKAKTIGVAGLCRGLHIGLL